MFSVIFTIHGEKGTEKQAEKKKEKGILIITTFARKADFLCYRETIYKHTLCLIFKNIYVLKILIVFKKTQVNMHYTKFKVEG